MRHVHFSHKVYTPKKYYDDFLRKSGEGVCECGHETTFRNAGNGYLEFCCHACFINSEKTRTNMSVKASGRKQSPETIQKRIANTNQSLIIGNPCLNLHWLNWQLFGTCPRQFWQQGSFLILQLEELFLTRILVYVLDELRTCVAGETYRHPRA